MYRYKSCVCRFVTTSLQLNSFCHEPTLVFCGKNCVAKEVQSLVLEQSPLNAYAINFGFKLVLLNIKYPPRATSFFFSYPLFPGHQRPEKAHVNIVVVETVSPPVSSESFFFFGLPQDVLLLLVFHLYVHSFLSMYHDI